MLTLHAVAVAATLATAPAVAPGASRAPGRAPAARPDTLRIAVVVDDTAAHRSLVHGAMLGAEEATHTGVLFGRPVRMTLIDRANFDAVLRDSSRTTGASLPSIYVVAGDSIFCSRFMQQSALARVATLDAGCPRAVARMRTIYAIDSRTATAEPDAGAHLELWHASLERFGAEQLNQRYRRHFNEAMDSDAWMGWFAMKVALDLALHADAASPSALLAQLADAHASFDGQKGRPLRFAADTHRLVQPLYRVVGVGDSSRVVAEVAP